jgi:hypothetical protein
MDELNGIRYCESTSRNRSRFQKLFQFLRRFAAENPMLAQSGLRIKLAP